MDWTGEQRKAIDSYGKCTVVSAAAGSGKTAVLVERIIKMLSDPSLGVEADRMLAATFTNDAANQMKEKISEAMSKKLLAEPENQWVAKQQELLPLASVCTIDSFCMDLVRSNINEFEVSGNFTVIDQEENKILTARAFEEAAELYYEKYPDKMKILTDNFAEEDDSEVLRYGMELLRFKGSLPFPEQWKRHMLLEMDSIPYKMNQSMAKKAMELEKVVIAGIDKIEVIAGEMGLQEKYSNACDSYRQAAEMVTDDPFQLSENMASEQFGSLTGVKFPSRKNRNKATYDENLRFDAINSAKESVKSCFKQLSSMKAISPEQATAEKQAVTEVFEILWEFVLAAEEILAGYKTERNKLYFSDITRMTISLLAKETENGFERTPLAQKIVDEKRYKIILIDEFQDVNNLQEVIFKCISDTDDLDILGKNVFVVGDVKQSIYRFRQSNPAVFEKAKRLASEKKNKDIAQPVLLRSNFRSRQNIIDLVNYIFYDMMTKEIGEVEYNSDEALVKGAKFAGDDPKTEIILIENESEEEDEGGDDETDEQQKETVAAECSVVAQKVKKMLDDGVPVYEDEKLRRCVPGDFCVLLRTGNLAAQYIKAFEAVNVKAATDSVKGYLGAREVSLALSMLRVIDNPMQDIPFAAVCLSPLFGFSPDEMARIRLIDRKKKLYQLFLAVSRDDKAEEYGFEPVDIGDEKLAEKCAAAISTIAELRFFAAGMSLEKLIRKLYDSTDFMSFAASYENSQQKRSNLRLLVKYASDYEKNSGGGLGDFLRYLDRVSESGNDFDEALTTTAGKDTVRIMTIHKSKGLQFPIVIPGDLAHEYRLPDSKMKLILNEHAGVGMALRDVIPKYNRHTLFYKYVEQTELDELLSEELRILYVALTRAKERLLIPLYFKSKGKSRLNKALDAAEARGKTSWEDAENMLSYSEILGYMLMFHPESESLALYLGRERPDVELRSKELPDISYSVGRAEAAVSSKSVAPLPPKPVDIKLFGEIAENITSAEQDNLQHIISKLSVTEYVRELEEDQPGQEISYFPPMPQFKEKTRRVTAAQKGTDTHLFMELADLTKAKQSVEQELARLQSLNLITAEQAKNVDIETVKGFFESEIYQMMEKSGRIMREKKFMVKLSDMKNADELLEGLSGKDVMLQGIADLIVETDDGCVLVDYKTDNVTCAEELLRRHSVQLLLYKNALDLILDKKIICCYIYSFKLRKAIKVDQENLQNIHINS